MRKLITSIIALSLVIPALALAEVAKIEVADPNPIKTNLENSLGKSVTLKLTSAEELSGVVAKVGPEAVQISQLSGKEFYDAVVPLEKIVALIVRAR